MRYAPRSREDASFAALVRRVGVHPNSAVVGSLREGPRRYAELLGELAGIDEEALTAGLRELDAQGLVARRVDPGPPLRVLYELTEAGAGLAPALADIVRWTHGESGRR